jgi:hypothetical protein
MGKDEGIQGTKPAFFQTNNPLYLPPLPAGGAGNPFVPLLTPLMAIRFAKPSTWLCATLAARKHVLQPLIFNFSKNLIKLHQLFLFVCLSSKK